MAAYFEHLENCTRGTSRDMLGYPGISLDLGITRDIPTYPYKNWDMFERKSYTWDILEKKNHILGYVFDLKLYQGYPRTSLLKQDKIRDNPGSFFAAPGGLPAAAGLRTPLGPGTIDLLASVLGLRHGKPPEALPPSAKLPQPRVHLVSVASPPAVGCGCIGGPMRESAGFEMA